MTDDIFGVSGKALKLCEDRSVLLSNNIVNSSTPHYKARDMDFHKLLQDGNQDNQLTMTNSAHIQSSDGINGEPTKYRIPMQSSLDGNTVDDEIERKDFIQNAVNYQVNLTFIQNKTDELSKAIKGD